MRDGTSSQESDGKESRFLTPAAARVVRLTATTVLALAVGALACSAPPATGPTLDLNLTLDPQEAVKLTAPPPLSVGFMGYKSEIIPPERIGWTDPTASVDLTFVLPGADGGSVVATISTLIGTGDEFSASILVSPGRHAVTLYRPRDATVETPTIEPPPAELPPELPPERGADGGDVSLSPDAGVDAQHADMTCDEPEVTINQSPVTCRDFCAHVQQQGCDPTGAADCNDVCAGLRWEMTGTQRVGNTLLCRDYKVTNLLDPDLGGTCDAAFWDRSACGTPCQVYCDAVRINCPGALDTQACVEACGAFTDLPCRVAALVAAGLDATAVATKCAQAMGTTCQ